MLCNDLRYLQSGFWEGGKHGFCPLELLGDRLPFYFVTDGADIEVDMIEAVSFHRRNGGVLCGFNEIIVITCNLRSRPERIWRQGSSNRYPTVFLLYDARVLNSLPLIGSMKERP